MTRGGTRFRATFEHETPMGRARYVHRLHGPDRYVFRIESHAGDACWKPMMEGRYNRQK